MADSPKRSANDDLHRELDDKSRQLSELEIMLADYHTERIRLIRDIRRLKARLRDAEEQAPANPEHSLPG